MMTTKMSNIRKALYIVCLLALTHAIQAQTYNVSPTKYDYSDFAQSITQNAHTQYDKAKAIFDWMADHISYDLSYSIRTADECIEQGKGVCQAYSELFYRLCEPLGIPCTIILGYNKDARGNIDPAGHSWVYVETERGGILIDPTWGAGSIVNNRYEQNKKDFWFDVDPYWMIFTHFPREAKWQMIDIAIDQNTFVHLPLLKPHCQYLGWNAKEIFTKWRDKKITSLPEVLSFEPNKALRFKSMPMRSKLNPARSYRFEVENPNNLEFAISVNGMVWYHCDRWTRTGNTYSIDVMPGAGGQLWVAIKKADGSYEYHIKYQVGQPTAEEKEYIIKNGPPTITPLDINTVKLVDIPMIGHLNPAKKYRFVVENPHKIDFALIINQTWYKSAMWKQNGDKWEIEIMPSEGGELKLAVANNHGSYTTMVQYQVAMPTEKEKEYIKTHKPPTMYVLNFESIKLVEYPRYRLLTPGKSYHFEVDNPRGISFALVLNGTWYKHTEWKQTGNRYSLDFVPKEKGKLHLFVQKPNQSTSYALLLEYEVK